MTDIQSTFYVKALNGTLVPAKYAQFNGDYISDPNTSSAQNTNIYDANGNLLSQQNVGGYLIVPQDWSINNAASFANEVISAGMGQINPSQLPTSGIGSYFGPEFGLIYNAFKEGGSQELQRTYDGGEYGNSFVPAFTDAASFQLGLVTSLIGIPEWETAAAGGAYNQAQAQSNSNIDTSGDVWGNTPRNSLSIGAGSSLANTVESSEGSTDLTVTLYNATFSNGDHGYFSPPTGDPQIDTTQGPIYNIVDQNGNIIRQIQFDPGTTIVPQNSGGFTVVDSSGNSAIINPDGTVSIKSQDGNIFPVDPSNSIIAFNPNGVVATNQTSSQADTYTDNSAGDFNVQIGQSANETSYDLGDIVELLPDGETITTNFSQTPMGENLQTTTGTNSAGATIFQDEISTLGGESTFFSAGAGAYISSNDATGSIADGAQITLSGYSDVLYLGQGSSATLQSITTNQSVTINQDGTVTDQSNGQSTILASGGAAIPSVYVTGVDTGQTYDAASLGVDAIVDQGTGNTLVGQAGNTLIANNNDNLQGSGCTDGIHCDGVQVQGSDNTVNADGDSSFAVTGGDNTVNAALGDTLTLSATDGQADTVNATGLSGGANGSITLSADTQATLAGGNDTATLSGGGTLTLNGGSGYQVGATDTDTVDAAANTGLTLTGGGVTATLGAGDTLTLDGNTGYVVDSGSNDTITAGAGGGLTVDGGSGLVVLDGSDTLTLGGDTQGYFVDATGDTIDGQAGVTFTVTGPQNVVNLATGAGVYVNGQGETVNASGDNVSIQAGSQVVVNGTGDSAYLNGGGSTLTASSATVSLDSASVSETVDGDGDTLTAGANTGDALTLSGTGDTAYLSDGSVTEEGASSLNLSGGDDTANLGAGGYLGLLGGGGFTVNASGATVDTWNDTSFALNGTNDSVGGSDDTISATANTSFTLSGGDDTADLGAGAALSLVNTGQAFDTVNASSGAGITLQADSQANINSADSSISLSAGDAAGVAGGGNTITVGSDQLLVIGGTNGVFDTIDASGVAAGQTASDGQATGIVLDDDTQATISSADSGISLNTGDAVSVNGASNTIAMGADELLVVGSTGGAGDTIDATGVAAGQATSDGQASGIDLNPGAEANLSGGDDTVAVGAGGYLGLLGGSGFTVNANSATVDTWNDTSFALNGTNDSVGGSDDAISAAANTSFTLSGTSNTVDLTSGDDMTFAASSSGDVNATGATINISSSESIGATGSDNTFTVQSSDVLTGTNNSTIDVYGTGNTVGGTGNTLEDINFAADATAYVDNGDADISLGSGSSVGLIGGDNYAVSGSGANIATAYSADFGLSGGNDTLTLGSGSVADLLSGDGSAINATGATVNLGASETLGATTGSDNTFTVQSGDVLTGTNNSTIDVYGTGNTVGGTGNTLEDINFAAGTSAYVVNGDADISLGSGSSVGLIGGSNYVLSGAGASVATAYGADLTLSGGNDTVSLASGSDLDLLSGGGYQINADSAGAIDIGSGVQATFSDPTGINWIDVSGDDNTVYLDNAGNYNQYDINLPENSSGEVIYANGSSIGAADGSHITVIGNDDTISGSYDSDISVAGDNDAVVAFDSNISFADGSTGDGVTGSGDSEQGWDDDDGGDDDGGDGGYGYYGYGFAAKKGPTGSGIGAIAAFDAANGDRMGAQTAEAARLQADAAAAETGPAGLASAAFEGVQWSAKTITWSLDVPTGSGSPFTGALGAQYEAAVQQAFSTWAKASGLNFDEVASGSSAAIKLGWDSFDTPDTGILGYTALKTSAGQITGAAIMLEDPSEDGLSTDSNGQLAYTGTGTEFEQLVLHEIGHALGLADSSDPDSVMAPTLSSANLALDSTDTDAIQALYGSGASAATAAYTADWSSFDAQSAQLIDAIAGFTSSGAAPLSSVLPPSTTVLNPIQLAAAH